MKRNMELVREVLLHLEDMPDGDNFTAVQIHGHDQAEVDYHLRIMAQGGLLEGWIEYQGVYSPRLHYDKVRLAWQGHEFLDAAKPTIPNCLIRVVGFGEDASTHPT